MMALDFFLSQVHILEHTSIYQINKSPISHKPNFTLRWFFKFFLGQTAPRSNLKHKDVPLDKA